MSNSAESAITLGEVKELLNKLDIFSIQAPGHVDSAALIDLFQNQKKKVIVDYDDYSFDLSPSNPRYTELGIKENQILDDKGNVIKDFRNMERKFDLKSNTEKYEAFKYCSKKADLITTTTEHLADYFRKINKNVTVCPNSIDFDVWKPIKRLAPQEEIRLGWFGGDSHHKDLEIFGQLFPYLQNKYPQVKFVILGPDVPYWKPIFKDVDPKKLVWHDWADLSVYTLTLASMDWDIGLCPLEDNEFNKCKSSIKHFEFGSLGIPVVVQNMLPYSLTVNHGKTGFLAKTIEDWIKYVSLLIEDSILRKNMGQEHYLDIFKNHNLEQHCRSFERAYERL